MNITTKTIIIIAATAFFALAVYALFRARNEVRDLETVVGYGERIVPGMPVYVDNINAGTVRDVLYRRQERIARLRIDNDHIHDLLRSGLIRTEHPDRLQLITDQIRPGASRLRDGSSVPAQSARPNLRDIGMNSPHMILTLAAILLFGFIVRGSRALLTMLLSIICAIIIAWVFHPVAIPFVERHIAFDYGVAADPPAPADPAGGTPAVRARIFEEITQRPPPAVIAFLLVWMAALIPSAMVISAAGSIAKRAVTPLIVVIGLTCLAPDTASARAISYSRNALLNDQKAVERLIDIAYVRVEDGHRLLTAQLVREASERVVEALFILDSADARLHGHGDRIGALKASPLRYNRAEEIAKLRRAETALRGRIRSARQDISDIQQRAAEIDSGEAVMLRIYLVLQGSYNNRIHQGLSEASVVINEVRQLAEFPFAVIRAGLVNVENMARCRIFDDGNIRLPNGSVVLPDGSPRREPGAPALDVLREEANQLRREIEEIRSSEALVPQTLPVVDVSSQAPSAVPHADMPMVAPEPIWRRSIWTLPDVVILGPGGPARGSPSREAGIREPDQTDGLNLPKSVEAVRADSNPAPVETAAVPYGEDIPDDVVAHPIEFADVPTSESSPSTRGVGGNTVMLMVLGVLAVLLFIALAMAGGAKWIQRPFEVRLARIQPGGQSEHFALVTRHGEVIVLGDGHPRTEPVAVDSDVPAILMIDPVGRARLIPGTGQARMDGVEVHGMAPARPGVAFELTIPDGTVETYSIRDVAAISEAHAADMEQTVNAQ